MRDRLIIPVIYSVEVVAGDLIGPVASTIPLHSVKIADRVSVQLRAGIWG